MALLCSNCKNELPKRGKKKFWEIATEQQKLERMIKSFESKVVKKENECWDWNGNLSDGYGSIKFEQKNLKAHRASWMLHKGKIPDDLYVCHTCDNRKCTNPDHLFLGTMDNNFKDMLKKKRHTKARFTEESVKELKKLLRDGFRTCFLAKKFNISISTVNSIKFNKSWKHVTI